MSRVAAVDCGTNSLRLLVADPPLPAGVGSDSRVDGQGPAAGPTPVLRLAPVVRLGEGLRETGRLSGTALHRAETTALELARRCRELSVERVGIVATAAARSAANADDLAAMLGCVFGDWEAHLDVIGGEREAALTFAGALTCGTDEPGPYLVVDSGGGSTEMALGTAAPAGLVSMPLGCVTLHEELAWPDPPVPEAFDETVERLREQIAAGLDAVVAQAGQNPRTLVALAGGATALTAFALGLSEYRSESKFGSVPPPGRGASLSCCSVWGAELAASQPSPLPPQSRK